MPHAVRGSDVFLKEDVRSILQALLVTNEMMATQVAGNEAQPYRSGFTAAIAAVATAFDITLDNRFASRQSRFEY
jgi:hypothetical protein